MRKGGGQARHIRLLGPFSPVLCSSFKFQKQFLTCDRGRQRRKWDVSRSSFTLELPSAISVTCHMGRAGENIRNFMSDFVFQEFYTKITPIHAKSGQILRWYVHTSLILKYLTNMRKCRFLSSISPQLLASRAVLPPHCCLAPLISGNYKNPVNRIRIIMGKLACTRIPTSSCCSSEKNVNCFWPRGFVAFWQNLTPKKLTFFTTPVTLLGLLIGAHRLFGAKMVP